MTAGSVVVFRTGQLGDTIVSLPAIAAIRRAHPGVPMLLFTERQSNKGFLSPWDVLEQTGWFSGVVIRNPGDGLAVHRHLARTLRALPTPRLYSLPHMPRTSRQVLRDRFFFGCVAGIRQCVGLRPTGPYPVRRADGSLARMPAESDRLLAWIRDGLPGSTSSRPADITPRLPLTQAHREQVGTFLAARGLSHFPFVTIGPGSKWATTRWPEDRFARVGRRLLDDNPSLHLVVVGGAGDREVAERLCASWGPRAVPVAGALGVFASAAVIERAVVHVGNDTGTLHLAASVGTPTVAIFSARDNPGKWEPIGNQHVALRHDPPCAGCYRTTCLHASVECLLAVPPDEVCGQVWALLGNGRRPAARA